MKKAEPRDTQTDIGMYDRSLITSITTGVTVNLLGMQFLKLEVEGTDPENNRRALVEILSTVIPANDPITREQIDKYLRCVLVRSKP